MHDVDSWRRMFVTSVSEGWTFAYLWQQELRHGEEGYLDVRGRGIDGGNKRGRVERWCAGWRLTRLSHT